MALTKEDLSVFVSCFFSQFSAIMMIILLNMNTGIQGEKKGAVWQLAFPREKGIQSSMRVHVYIYKYPTYKHGIVSPYLIKME